MARSTFQRLWTRCAACCAGLPRPGVWRSVLRAPTTFRRSGSTGSRCARSCSTCSCTHWNRPTDRAPRMWSRCVALVQVGPLPSGSCASGGLGSTTTSSGARREGRCCRPRSSWPSFRVPDWRAAAAITPVPDCACGYRSASHEPCWSSTITPRWVCWSSGCWPRVPYRPVHVRTVARALALARENPPDVIILDIVMPQYDGWEAQAALGRDPRTSGIPVIVCSVLPDRISPCRSERRGSWPSRSPVLRCWASSRACSRQARRHSAILRGAAAVSLADDVRFWQTPWRHAPIGAIVWLLGDVE